MFPLGPARSSFCIQNGKNSEKSNHMLSATSHIEFEFLTKFLNMSQFQNRLILLYPRVPLHFDENFKFLKNCPSDFHKILSSHSTPKGAPACSKASKSYDWNVRNIARISPKMAKISPKTAIFRLFRFSQKLSIRFKRYFLQSFYTIIWSFMCNFIKFVLLGCEKPSQN